MKFGGRSQTSADSSLSSTVAIVLLLGLTLVMAVIGGHYMISTVQNTPSINPSETEVSMSTSSGDINVQLTKNAPETLILQVDGTTVKTVDNPSVGETYTFTPDDEYSTVSVIARAGGQEAKVVDSHRLQVQVGFQDLSSTTPPVISAVPNDAGAASTHRAYVEISGSGTVGSSLLHFTIDYSVGSATPDLSSVDMSSVETVGIDRDGDGEIEENVMDDLDSVTVSNGKVIFDWGGSYGIQSDDYIIVKFTDLNNPAMQGESEVDFITNKDSANHKESSSIRYD